MTEQFVAALVGAPFGVKGFVKLKPLSGEWEHLEQLDSLTLRREGRDTLFEIEESTRVGVFLAVKLRGIDTPEAAKTLTGAELIIDRAHAAPLGRDEYYVEDLRGIAVVSEDAGEGVLGEIRDVIEGGGGALIEMQLPTGELRLVPFRKEFFGEMDLEKRRVVLREPWILE